MQLDAFKIRHLGFRDVRTRFDVSYPHSDVLYIYDIQNMMTQSFQTKLENALVDVYELEQDVSVMGLDPKDARVTLTISEAVPAMGAVTVDVSAKIKGKIIKAGFDYLPPSIPDPDFRASPDATRLAPDNT